MSNLITVIVPVYKVEKYIEGTIRSITNQTFKDFELVVVDDGSPDRSASIAEGLLRDSSVVYKILHTENRGVSSARNIGIRAASGKYVIMVDADDIISPYFLEIYADLVSRFPESDIYSTGFKVVADSKDIQFGRKGGEIKHYSPKDALQVFSTREVKFLLPSLLFERTFLIENEVLFDEAVRYSEDVQFIWRALAFNRHFIFHEDVAHYYYILHPGSTMTASGVKKILTGCEGVKRLYNDIQNELTEPLKSRFLPIWYFAMLHGSAHMLAYRDFATLYRESESRKQIWNNARNSSGNVKIVSYIMLISRRIGYLIMKKY